MQNVIGLHCIPSGFVKGLGMEGLDTLLAITFNIVGLWETLDGNRSYEYKTTPTNLLSAIPQLSCLLYADSLDTALPSKEIISTVLLHEAPSTD